LFQIACVGIFSALVLGGFERRDVQKIIALFCVLGFLAAIYGVLQNYGFEILGYSPEAKTGRFNVVSVFGNPNYLAAYMAPVFLLIINFLLMARRLWRRIVWGLMAVTVLYCLLLAGARSAWLSLIFSLPLLFLFRAKGRSGLVPRGKILGFVAGTVLIFAILLFLILPHIGTRYNWRKRVEDVMPLLSRFYSWRMAGEMLKAHPFLGVGYGCYKVRYWDYVDAFQQTPRNAVYDYRLNYGHGVPPVNVHNEFLEVAAESGIFGFCAFIFFLSALFSHGWGRLACMVGEKGWNDPISGVLAALSCILIDSMFNFPLHQPLSAFLFWVLCAIVSGAPVCLWRATAGKDT
jgi:O-antigen ligase